MEPRSRARIVSTATKGLPSLNAQTCSSRLVRAAASLPERESERTSKAVSGRERGASSRDVAWRSRPSSANAPADECEQPQTHLVGPMDVLEHQDQRPPGRETLDEM